MKPATPLPWSYVVPGDGWDKPDADYVLHAANAYPRLVEWVKRMAEDLEEGHWQESKRAMQGLLRELGEL